MLLDRQQRQYRAFVDDHVSLPRTHRPGNQSPETSLKSSMERSAPEYSQSGLPSPYPSAYGDTQSEASSADHSGSAAQYSSGQEGRSTNYSTSATPTSEYSVYPPSARSSSFPEHIQRAYHPAGTHSGSTGGMAQTPTSPSMPLADGRHQSQQVKSDSDVPIDPSIAAPSPTYGHSQYSPYPPQHQDMQQSYGPQSGSLYPQARPDWATYGHGGHMGHPQQVFPGTPTSGAPPGRPAQVYSFVPIPGAQQHKRPRRRYEEIERMYKCGWQGCEKAYGTLNHLNAHVTMQSHGQKRTPEEFKEIRKEWKARKKEEDQARKAQEEQDRQRHVQQAAAAAAHAQNGAPGPDGADANQPPQPYSGSRLPPIGYQPAGSQYPAPPSATVPQQPLPDYSPTSNMYPGHYPPPSPYAPPGQQQMYNQRQ
ncbi:putative transcriptional regulator [Xylariales sp. AK1849]|nr:putative transcriptional regulator [Xylariales sp. AK1849]